MTGPGKGNDWKRDAKAGFTRVILVGQAIAISLNQIQAALKRLFTEEQLALP